MARDALPRRETNLTLLRQVGDARAELTRRRIDDIHRRPLRAHGLRDARPDHGEQRVEVHLLREQRAEVEEQRELVFPLDHGVGG